MKRILLTVMMAVAATAVFAFDNPNSWKEIFPDLNEENPSEVKSMERELDAMVAECNEVCPLPLSKYARLVEVGVSESKFSMMLYFDGPLFMLYLPEKDMENMNFSSDDRIPRAETLNRIISLMDNDTGELSIVQMFPICYVEMGKVVEISVYGDSEYQDNLLLTLPLYPDGSIGELEFREVIPEVEDDMEVVEEVIVVNEDDDFGLDNQVYEAVDDPGQFPGGLTSLRDYIAGTICYPQEAVDANIQGRVVVRFVIEKDGSVSNVEVLKGVDPYLDAEALRVVRSMPKWAPGKNNGQPVRSHYTLPVNFKLPPALQP